MSFKNNAISQLELLDLKNMCFKQKSAKYSFYVEVDTIAFYEVAQLISTNSMKYPNYFIKYITYIIYIAEVCIHYVRLNLCSENNTKI